MDRIPESLGQVAPQLVAPAVSLLGFTVIVREQAALVGANRELLDRIKSRIRAQ